MHALLLFPDPFSQMTRLCINNIVCMLFLILDFSLTRLLHTLQTP